MASTAPKTIVLQVANQLGDVTRRESLAYYSDIVPGHLLNHRSATTVGVHNVADGFCEGKMVALETQHPDSETLKSIIQPYATGDTVYYAEGKPGDIFYMWLAAQNEAVMTPPSPLASNGDGTLKVVVVGAGTLEGAIVGVADEAIAAGALSRIRVRIT